MCLEPSTTAANNSNTNKHGSKLYFIYHDPSHTFWNLGQIMFHFRCERWKYASSSGGWNDWITSRPQWTSGRQVAILAGIFMFYVIPTYILFSIFRWHWFSRKPFYYCVSCTIQRRTLFSSLTRINIGDDNRKKCSFFKWHPTIKNTNRRTAYQFTKKKKGQLRNKLYLTLNRSRQVAYTMKTSKRHNPPVTAQASHPKSGFAYVPQVMPYIIKRKPLRTRKRKWMRRYACHSANLTEWGGGGTQRR